MTLPHLDIIGDVHGCFDELYQLLKILGYEIYSSALLYPFDLHHPHGHQLIFLGDMCDRGPKNVECIKVADGLLENGKVIWVKGNHDDKLERYLKGRPVHITDGLDTTLKELSKLEDDRFKDYLIDTLQSLPHYLYIPEYDLYLVHACMDEALQRDPNYRKDAKTKMMWERDWASSYKGKAAVIHGHTPIDEFPTWQNNVLNIDTGCVFGGYLTAISYPSLHITQVKSSFNYLDKFKEEERILKEMIKND